MKAFKLKEGLGNVFKHIKTKVIEDLEILYNDLKQSKEILSANNYQNELNQHQMKQINSFTAQTNKFVLKKTKLSTKKSSSQRNSQSTNTNKTNNTSNTNKTISNAKQLKQITQQRQRLLFSKKRQLLNELQKIDSEIKSCYKEKEKLSNSRKLTTQNNQEQMSKKASQFIKKLNKQRQEFTLRRKKSVRQMNKSIDKSIQAYKTSLIQEQKIKQIKRIQIQKRIEQRKYQAILRNKINKRSNSVIKQLMDIIPLHNSSHQIKQNLKVNYNTSNSPNPQYNVMNEIQKPLKTEKSVLSIKTKTKKYQPSPFLQKVLKQDEMKRRIDYLKSLQKKRVALKHKEYADKIRGKAKLYGDNHNMFVT